MRRDNPDLGRRAFVGSLAAPAVQPLWAQSRSPFSFREAGGTSIEIIEEGRPALVYNHGMMLREGVDAKYRRSSYIHPLYAPDGTVLTDDFPKDHPHHRGVCWSWPIVKFDRQTHDVWAVIGMHQRFVRWIRREVRRDGATLEVENGWFVGERKAVKETVEITVRPTSGKRRKMVTRLSFEAVDAPVEICGREVKGYGGFGVRFAPRSGTVIRTDKGVEPKDTDMVPHPWAELEADFNGRRAGLRVEDASTNPRYPNGWCLRHYGYVAVNHPGLAPLTLTPGKPFALTYGMTSFSVQS